mmetsp:Transcript_9651/g.28790  ORF Transcript_9651/g.28790 Transcript_9651/m.28790 type:complete len:139 (-) Transcript_9651:159-575(-)|eukprot:CAMPEP_0172374428 /NCGR_PEP_ID=MMETSP1060-20121228/55814_1 /TAXON_ID=37318 /ORGANISM="Pseudo-nitzschia pungens, Strain cf. cingulata" /LENGTH=138 /DNA_ID=CAMNT_0013101107 /DNA_START=382 /DNA_END=798 /DNA_ORIENTATION=-
MKYSTVLGSIELPLFAVLVAFFGTVAWVNLTLTPTAGQIAPTEQPVEPIAVAVVPSCYCSDKKDKILAKRGKLEYGSVSVVEIIDGGGDDDIGKTGKRGLKKKWGKRCKKHWKATKKGKSEAPSEALSEAPSHGGTSF